MPTESSVADGFAKVRRAAFGLVAFLGADPVGVQGKRNLKPGRFGYAAPKIAHLQLVPATASLVAAAKVPIPVVPIRQTSYAQVEPNDNAAVAPALVIPAPDVASTEVADLNGLLASLVARVPRRTLGATVPVAVTVAVTARALVPVEVFDVVVAAARGPLRPPATRLV